MLEKEIIKTYFKPLTLDAMGADELNDDIAVLGNLGDGLIALNMDTLVAGTHFFEDDPADLVARKVLRTNLSDIAAKGSDALAYLLSIAIPKNCDVDYIKKFTQGLAQDQALYGVSLIGGDTVKTSGPLTITITMFGLMPDQKVTRRAYAQDGDDIYVTGSIGNGALGLLSHPNYQDLDQIVDGFASHLDHFYCPEPRVELKSIIREFANASMDISDGLIGDLECLLNASKKGADINLANIPLNPDSEYLLKGRPELINPILKGGDDYEILFTAPKSARAEIEQYAKSLTFNVTKIGEVKADQPIEYHNKPALLTLNDEDKAHNHQW